MIFENLITLIFAVAVIILMSIAFYNAKKKNPDKDPGIDVLLSINSNKVAWSVVITVCLLLSECIIAGTITQVGEVQSAFIGRLVQHIVVSLAGFVFAMGFFNYLATLFTKFTFVDAFLTIFCLVLMIYAPYANLQLIAAGYKSTFYLTEFWFQHTTPSADWTTYLHSRNLPEEYNATDRMPYPLLGCLFANILNFFVIIYDSVVTLRNMAVSKVEKKEESKEGNEPKDGFKFQGEMKLPDLASYADQPGFAIMSSFITGKILKKLEDSNPTHMRVVALIDKLLEYDNPSSVDADIYSAMQDKITEFDTSITTAAGNADTVKSIHTKFKEWAIAPANNKSNGLGIKEKKLKSLVYSKETLKLFK